ncbi:MAG: hypothetical protein ACFFB3_18810 [Candidatus Hodarchaeota archaeon]
MKIKRKNRKADLFATISAISLAMIVIISVFFLSELDFFGSADVSGPGPAKASALGTRIATYMDSRGPDVAFAWSFNNTVVNSDLSEHLNDYVHGVFNYGPSVSSVQANVSVFMGIEDFRMETAEIDPLILELVADSFEMALNDLEDVSADLKELEDVWPATFIWDIAYSDFTALTLVYSQERHVIAAVNGTWTLIEIEIAPGHFVPYPEFQYDENIFGELSFLELDDASEVLVATAIQSYIDMTVSAFL